MTRMQEEIKAKLEERLDVAKIEFHEVVKSNGVKFNGFTIYENNDDNWAPTLYMDESRSVEENVEGIANTYLREVNSSRLYSASDLQDIINSKEKMLERIVPCLVNRERNEELLKEAVHTPFLDLEVIFRIDVGKGTFILKKDIADRAEISTEEAYACALKNMEGLKQVSKLSDIMKELLLKEGLPEEMIDMMLSDVVAPMFVITSKDGCNGAGAILCDSVFDELQRLGNEFYIFPSSRHEVIVVSSEAGMTPGECKKMVMEVNRSTISPEDYLSDSVYIWKNGRLEVAV